ncbi:MAG: DegV family protein [Clostridia bacterium]|nr:DegV family protein [Clostridia bacterium]
MAEIKVLTDTGCDMLDKLAEKGIDFVPLYVTFDGTNYLKQSKEVSIEEFYKRLAEKGAFHPKTSCPSLDDYYAEFKKYIDEGKGVFFISVNASWSGAYQAATLAAGMIKDENPNAQIEIFDSNSCTYMQYHMCLKAKEMFDNEKSFDDVKAELEKMKQTMRTFMYVDDLTCMAKSGRVKGITAQLAALLNIKPILEFKDGVLGATKKAKGSNKALATVISDLQEYLDGKNVEDFRFGVVQGDRLEDAEEFMKELKETLHTENVEICKLGVCIGLHAGPSLLGVSLIQVDNLK